MRKFTVAVVMGFALVAWSQERGGKVVPKNPSSHPAKPSLAVPQMDKGIVEGKTYKNPSIGLEFSPAPELELGTPELKGTPGTLSESVSVAAMGEKRWFSTRESTYLFVDALASNPVDERTAEAGMRKSIRANRELGFEPVEGTPKGNLGGVAFLRQDFRKGSYYSAALGKTCDTLELLFIFTGSDRDEINKLIAATQLKLDLARTGCSPSSNDASK